MGFPWCVEVTTQRGKRHTIPCYTRADARRIRGIQDKVPFVRTAKVCKVI